MDHNHSRTEEKSKMKMKSASRWTALSCLLAVIGAAGCTESKPLANPTGSGGGASSPPPAKFTLAWSEYPSWSIFGVADEVGLINGKEGAMGLLEKKHNVDIVLVLASYDQCITLYGNSQADAVCITNIDILAAAGSRTAVAILPTSTSAGADACITAGIDKLEDLKGKTTWGLEKSVSQYCFDRCLEKRQAATADYPFKQMDPEQAAQAFQGKDPEVSSIMVWNPFVMQSLRSRADATSLFSSSEIPEEIIDMVVVGADSLSKPGGKAFAAAVLETFYAMTQRMADPATTKPTLVGIGARFAKLELEDMETIVQQTRFYSDPNDAVRLFSSDTFQKETMKKVSDFCVRYGMTPQPIALSFGTGEGAMDFDTSHLKSHLESQKK
jgi:ABC-type nitrate/sulfonate/bicarbonate transport system substrate-binding protein